MARDRGGPALGFQLLTYPVVDFADQSPSMRQYATDHFLTRDLMDWFIAQYVASAEEARHPYASPMNAPDFRGLPPAMVLTGECDPLRDQGELYARKLQAAGVPVEAKRYDGMIHPFFNLGGIIDAARTAMADAASALRAALTATSATAASRS
jgi:acetyl esterase